MQKAKKQRKQQKSRSAKQRKAHERKEAREKLDNDLGRLRSLGVSCANQLPLLFPRRWEDCRESVDLFSPTIVPKKTMVMECFTQPGQIYCFERKGVHWTLIRATGLDADDHPPVLLSIKGGTPIQNEWKTLYNTVKPKRFFIIGRLLAKKRRGENVVVVKRKVPEYQIGRIQPIYPAAPPSMKSETVTKRVDDYMMNRLTQPDRLAARWMLSHILKNQNISERKGIPEDVARAMIRIAIAIRLDCIGETENDIPESRLHTELAKRIRAAQGMVYTPETRMSDLYKSAKLAAQDLYDIAAVSVFLKARQNTPPTAEKARFSTPAPWQDRAAALPFTLTDEQYSGIARIVNSIQRGSPVRYIISGDVGSGKTYVYAVAAMSVIDGGGRVQVIAPNQHVARQVFEEMTTIWPDLGDGKAKLVLGNSVKPSDGAPLSQAALVIGTTALLSEKRGIGQVDLNIADEQHKFSVAQREAAVDSRTHHIEATATCIPRSQALLSFGVINVIQLKKRHTPKTIHTRLLNDEPSAKREVIEKMKQVVRGGGQVLAVYPAKDDTNENFPLKSAEGMRDRWEKLFPGRVRLSHGGLSDDENEKAIADMKQGNADILVATTVVEVGVTIPALRYIVVSHPERLGNNQLHQIRGRAARKGGEGFFDMILDPEHATPKRRERLEVLVQSDDGFWIAEQDMNLRGAGDLGSASELQRGRDLFLIPDYSVQPVEVRAANAFLAEIAPTVNDRLVKLGEKK